MVTEEQQSGERPVVWWVQALAAAIPAGVGLPLVFSKIYLLQLFGIAAVGLGLYALVPLLLQSIGSLDDPWVIRGRRVAWLPRSLPMVALVIVTLGLLWPTLLGMMVQSQDHTIHLARAWHFVTQMLAKGQLSGWSDIWFAGYPAGEDYPPGGDWLIALVYLCTFGLLGWEASYAIALAAMYAIAAGGVYAFGRVYFGRLAGFLGALFFLLDRGQYREGGWNYTIYWGVWPQVLSSGFTFFAFAALDRVLVRGRPRDFAVAASMVGLALVAHPVAVLYFGLGLPIYLLARALGGKEPAGRVVARTLGVFSLGGALAAFWVLPFVAKGSWMAKYGELWKTLDVMGSGLWQGTLFDNAMPPVIILGVFGAAVALWRRNFGGTFLFGYGAATLFIASSTAFQRLDLLTLSPSFGQIQFQRLSILAKPCIWLLAGYALAVLFSARERKRLPFAWRRYALAGLLAFAAAPFAEPVLKHYAKTYGRELGRPRTRKQVAYWKSYQQYLSWSKETLGKELQRGPFFRVAYVRSYNDHYFGAATAYNHLPSYKVGYTPAINFIHKPDKADRTLYKLLNVKYVVSIGAGRADLELVKRFGAITVSRFKGYSPSRFTLKGPGQVNIDRFDPGGDGMQLRVSGATAQSKLTLHVANYPNWRAQVEGERLPITTGALDGHEMFIEVPAKNGLITFTYGWPAVNILGSLLSWLALLVLGLFALNHYRSSPLVGRLAGPLAVIRKRLAPWGPRLERYGVALGVGMLILVAGAMALKGRGKARQGPKGEALIDRLADAKVTLARSSGTKVCKKDGLRHQCSPPTWNYVGPSSERVGDALRRCIWAHPVQGAKLRVTFPGRTLGRTLLGHHGLTDNAVRSFSSGAPVKLEVFIDGKSVKTDVRANSRGFSEWRVDTVAHAGKRAEVAFEISTARSGGRHYCFDAMIVK
ncbi:MAG: hypothetical protein JRH20_03795 [Deltaproteobacteria bacterium]|nr:hypothetical protein [Deltaproteobacteria bacterium]